MVVAHNSPFDIPHNAASNQVYGVTQQLNDGIRGLQFETHMQNNTLRLCHTSCDLLDVGTLEAYLASVVKWLEINPYEVVTIMMGNDDRVDPENYVAPIINSGLLRYVYTTPQNPMPLSAWPTFAEMILSQKRVVVMLDYLANQTAIPWLLDQFGQQWQTPFSPTDLSFPCTEQRPPKQPRETSKNRMYMMNHNLNIEISIASISLLVPTYGILNQTNSANAGTFGSLQRGVENCTAMWGRPPNFLLVDFYNLGNFNGSVFQVAAMANNVSYNRTQCCGTSDPASNGAEGVRELVDWRGALLGTVVLFVALR
jgi:hypothetical protein